MPDYRQVIQAFEGYQAGELEPTRVIVRKRDGAAARLDPRGEDEYRPTLPKLSTVRINQVPPIPYRYSSSRLFEIS